VTAGQKLYIYVGGGGSTGNSFNGGGSGYYGYCGGGGATDVRTISGNLTSRLIVAGGGGGHTSYEAGIAGNGGTKLSCVSVS
jgi:Glycine rich protein